MNNNNNEENVEKTTAEDTSLNEDSALNEEEQEEEQSVLSEEILPQPELNDDDGDDFSVEAGNEEENAEEESEQPEDNEDNSVLGIHQPVELLSRRAARKAKNADFKKITKSKFFKIPLIVLGIILAAAIAVYAACIVTLPTDTVSRNVYVEDLNVSGLTYDNALKSIEKTYLLENQKITLSCNMQSYSIDGLDVALTASPEETAKKAFEFGKSGNKLKDGFTAFTLLFHKRVIIPSASFDEEKMREKINEFGNQVFGERKNHYVEIADGKAIVWPGTTGYDGNSETAFAQITEALKNEHFLNVSVSLASAAPDELTVGQFDTEVYADPVDAHFEVENNEVKIIEETNGRYINKEEAAELLKNVVEGGGPIEIPYYYSYASVTASDIKDKLFADSLASYSTSYASSTSNRASNVARAASLINGKVLAPGEVFSFNDTVGKRTVANGFSTAPEYVDGKTVDGIGGGTCQVSSTLYNAVIYADLEIVTRTNHMFTVSYVPNGQDATVADSGPDFKFKNNTNYPIKISAYTGGGQITVSIIGTNWEPKHEVKISNSTSYSSNGDTHVSTTRTVSANGSVIKTESLPSSTYKKHVEETSQSSSGSSGASSASSPRSSAAASSTSVSASASQSSAASAPQSEPAAASQSSETDSESGSSGSDTSQSSDSGEESGSE